jgi:hypothetical protein
MYSLIFRNLADVRFMNVTRKDKVNPAYVTCLKYIMGCGCKAQSIFELNTTSRWWVDDFRYFKNGQVECRTGLDSVAKINTSRYVISDSFNIPGIDFSSRRVCFHVWLHKPRKVLLKLFSASSNMVKRSCGNRNDQSSSTKAWNRL